MYRTSTAVAACLAATWAFASAAPASAQAKPDFKTWDQYLGGGDSSQYSSLDQINQKTVKNLKLAWSYATNDEGERGSYRFNPLIVGKVMYVIAHQNALVALDAATGKELWRHAMPPRSRVGTRGASYWASADGKDRRIFLTVNGMLSAFNADNGEAITSFGDNGQVDLRVGLDGDISQVRPLQTDNPGRVFENLIIMSLPAGAYSFASSPADIHAYDVRTGKLVWKFNVIAKVGEPGGDTWPARDHEKFGGGHNWNESTIDVENGIMFIPTGTARYDFYGANRPGNNLYTDSLLALDARTGKLKWHFQAVHHDLWDYDLPQAPKLLTLHKDGKVIPAVAQGTKFGFLFVFNRLTGEPVFPIEEKPVPVSDAPGEKSSPTQPYPTVVEPFARQKPLTDADVDPYLSDADKAKVLNMIHTYRNQGIFTPPSVGGTIEIPGHGGGANWGSSAVDPEHGLFYVVSKDTPTPVVLKAPAAPGEKPAPFTLAAGVEVPNGDEGFVGYSAPVDFWTQSNGLPPIAPPWSRMTAYDLNTGKKLWEVPDGDVMTLAAKGVKGTGSLGPRGGPVVTAGGLIFAGTASDRKLRARSVADGSVLWEADLPAAPEGPAAVFEEGGAEYVTVPVGGNGQFAPTGDIALPPPGPGAYMTFALPK
jgi:quinoprotein glucose dehydrogenase